MSSIVFPKGRLNEFTANLLKTGKVIGVTPKDGKFVFAEIENDRQATLDYDVTVLSPRAFIQPASEKLFDFSIGAKTEVKANFSSEKQFIFGVHTYDLRAINQMDKIWAEKNPDEHYASRRKNTAIIAVTPTKASKWSFWSAVESVEVKNGFDLLFTDIGNSYFVEIGTDWGKKIISDCAPFATKATSDDEKTCSKVKQNVSKLCADDRSLPKSAKDLPAFVSNAYEHAIWEKQAEKCYSCGSCNIVCPTCYCFDVKDNLSLDLVHGERTRRWDGCLLDAFAKVGTGENFREHRANRFRHRILRKMVYVPEKIGELACVGCGRCSSACLPDITDPVKIIKEIAK